MRPALALSGVLSGMSLLVVRPAPSYDPWAWLLWGREVLHGELSTVAGPAFKPLPVALCALLAGFGNAAPWLWVLLARTAAALAVVLAWRWGSRLGGGRGLAGAAAALAVALCGQYLLYAASGLAEGLLLALALLALEGAAAGRPRRVLACAVGAALLRVETWPFLVVAGAVAWRRRPQDRALILLAAVGVVAAWIVPELVGSGQALRSAARAQVPNPGQPALAHAPALASLRTAVALPLWPLWAGVGLLVWRGFVGRSAPARLALVPAAAGTAWIALVAVMAEAGFSGEPRYALPGATLVAISGAVGLVSAATSRPRSLAVPVIGGALLAVAAAPALVRLAEVSAAQTHQWELQSALPTVIGRAGGADAVLACGTPYVARLRGPLLAYHLGVARSAVEPDRPPRAPGVVFQASLSRAGRPVPPVPEGFRESATAGPWRVFASC